MRKLLFFACFFIFPVFNAAAFNTPEPKGFVNDFAGVISFEYNGKLQQLTQEVEQKTTAEITIVTIDSIAPYDEKEYAQQLFDNWKIGKKGKDNGVLLLLAVKERRWRIQPGYGLEGILPDGLCGEIGRSRMVPFFKQKDYGQGLYEGVSAIAVIIAKNAQVTLEYAQNASPVTQQNTDDLGFPFVLTIVIIFVIFSIILRLRQFLGYHDYDYYHRNRWYDSGGYSGGGFGGSSGGGFGGFGGGSSGGGGAGGGF